MHDLGFERELDFREGIGMRGASVAQTVDAEGWVALIGGIINPAVFLGEVEAKPVCLGVCGSVDDVSS